MARECSIDGVRTPVSCKLQTIGRPSRSTRHQASEQRLDRSPTDFELLYHFPRECKLLNLVCAKDSLPSEISSAPLPKNAEEAHGPFFLFFGLEVSVLSERFVLKTIHLLSMRVRPRIRISVRARTHPRYATPSDRNKVFLTPFPSCTCGCFSVVCK